MDLTEHWAKQKGKKVEMRLASQGRRGGLSALNFSPNKAAALLIPAVLRTAERSSGGRFPD